MTSSKAKRFPFYYYVLVECKSPSPRLGGYSPRKRVIVIRARLSTKGCLPHKVKRGSGSGDVGGSFRRKGRSHRRSPTPPLQSRPPSLLLPPMAERVQDITAKAPVQKNCLPNRLEPTNPTSPVVPSAPSPGHLFYNSEDRSDLHFLVGREGWRFPAHSFIIGRERNTLDALLSRAHREAGLTEDGTAPRVLRLPDVDPEVFEQMLRFIYTNQTSFSTVESTLRLLRPSQTFHLPLLTQRCLNHLSASLDANNVLPILSHLVSQEPVHEIHPRLVSISIADCGVEQQAAPPSVAETQEARDDETPRQAVLPVTPATSSAAPNTASVPKGVKGSFARSVSENDCGYRATRTADISRAVPSNSLASTTTQSVAVSIRGERFAVLNTARENVPAQDGRHSAGSRCVCSRFGEDCPSIRGHPCAEDFCCHVNDNVRNELLLRCFELVDAHAEVVLTSETFETLDYRLLMDIVRRDTLAISSESQVFEALMRWACRTCKRRRKELTPENKCGVLEEALFTVRYLTMTLEEFLRGPVSQGVLSKEDKELFLSRLSNRVSDPLPERWRGSKVSVPRWKGSSLLSPDHSLTDSSVSPTDAQQPVEPSVKRKKKSMSKKLLNGVGDLVICVIQLLD